MKAGERKDIVVTINHGLDKYSIGFIRQIEKQIDSALAPVGFSRSISSKSNNEVTLNYWQFGQTL